jgi:L-alanine-DL-glutamate epimerase-like enolase superfamily enzyme
MEKVQKVPISGSIRSSDQLTNAFSALRFEATQWKFVDFRINIPAQSFGSDAINPHTQYSNPIAILDSGQWQAIGASFTLGEGNQMVCEAADFIVRQLDGKTVSDLMESEIGFYETITNPLQLRWLSPNAGLSLMAAGLIVNTLIDAASKVCNLPAWEYLAKLPTEFLLDLLEFRHLPERYNRSAIKAVLDQGLHGVNERCNLLRSTGLPVYFTTWIGHSAQDISEQINNEYSERGIRKFKLKISENIDRDATKIRDIIACIPRDVVLCVDANQTLSFDAAVGWMSILSELDILWLEEPFAPDNSRLFEELVQAKQQYGWTCEVVTGENCPNHYTAASLMESGVDRFQADPCRMLGLLDTVLTSCIARIEDCPVTPHAGGSSLDEQSPHIQLFNLARVQTELDPLESLTENVGFCSQFFSCPTVVNNGRLKTPSSAGLLVGMNLDLQSTFRNYKEGTTWLEL